ncbi:MAG TPA: hypothetical protein VK888_11095, partial [Anaerolineales bacterium]|nr:hypothetical protein [Anaerolineales bacterium]
MATNGNQETLDRILAELKSDDPARCVQALEELNSLKFSSSAILKELERLAIHHADEVVRRSAVDSLGTSVHQFVRRNLNKLNHGDRAFLLKQIEGWENDGLLPSNIADVLSARYDFDLVTPQTALKAAPNVEKPSPLPPVPSQPVNPSGPRPTLTQTLLSEASIKIYLYLGAFFVIAAALILAAVVEAARLPILVVATLAFGGGALALRKRLPQPSFALFIVFSFLLPIDANVFEETIGFSEPSLSIYWTLLFLMMAIIWGFSIWLYESRLFSVVAFVSLSLAFYRAGEIFNAEPELYIFLGILASLAGLAGAFALKTWKDAKFSLFIFLLAQAQVLGLLFLSLAFALIDVFDSNLANEAWLLVALTWLIAVAFFVLSDRLIPFVLFPWMAVAALLPLPWFVLNTFNLTTPAYAFGFLIWGIVHALASEVAFRSPFEKVKKYYGTLLAGSLPLFITSLFIALDWAAPRLTFAILALIALAYGALHLIRPRWYVWSTALLGALSAFFAFFQLPTIERLEVPFVYQILIASVLLVIPELFTRSPLSWKSETRWPALVVGSFVSALGITLALADFENSGHSALALIVYAVLCTLHAWHPPVLANGARGKREGLGYFATALEALALVYALDHFNLDLWMPALTTFSILYYAAGVFFRRRDDELNPWG